MTGGFRTGLETRELCADIVRHGREQAQGEIIFVLDFFIFLFSVWNLESSSGLSDRSQILGQQPSFSTSGMSWSMIGVLTRELYKPLGIPSHFPPIQGSPLHSSERPPLRFTVHNNHLQWTLPPTPKPSARNSSWPSRACPALCPHFRKHGVSHKSRCTRPPCLLSTLPRAKPRYAHALLDLPIVSVLTLALAPQSTLEIRHSVPPVIDRDAPTHPSVFSVSSANDEGVFSRSPFFDAVRS